MSDGIAWAYEQKEREEKLRSLGLCIHCEKKGCDCELRSEEHRLFFLVRFHQEKLEQAQRELREFLIKHKRSLVKGKKKKR